MMRRRSSLIFRLILAPLLPFVVGEPGIIDACPVHGNIALLTGRNTPPVAMHQAAAHQSSPASGHHDHKGCSCLGLCTAGATAAVLPAPGGTTFAAEITSVDPQHFFVEVRWQSTSPYERPFATGPPAA